MGNIVAHPYYDKMLHVVHANYKGYRDMSADELFDGYDDLKVITYSYSLDFIEYISDKFNHVTVLLGCERVVQGDIYALVIAAQQKAIQQIVKHKRLTERALAGEIDFRVAHDICSHEKVYLLTNTATGDTRVITGSANFSSRGFSGPAIQAETFYLFDNQPDAFDDHLAEFENLSDFTHAEDIPAKMLSVCTDQGPDIHEIPIVKRLLVDEVNIVADNVKENSELVEYVMDVGKNAQLYAQLMPKNSGRTAVQLTPKRTNLFLKKYKDEMDVQAEKQKEFPKLHVDYTTGRITFNGHPYNLADVSVEALSTELVALQDYFAGYDNFIGDSARLKRIYFKTMCFILTAPFIGMLRHVAMETDCAVECFPYFIVIRGQKSAGKTEFVKTMQYLMTGKMLDSAQRDIFTKTAMPNHLIEIEGVPVLIDDMESDYFNRNAGMIIKGDPSKICKLTTHHGIYVITSNNIMNKPEYEKRVYFASVNDITQNNETSAAGRKLMSGTRRKFKTIFYTAYLAKMYPKVQALCSMMREAGAEVCLPDVFKASSETVLELFAECGMEAPDYMQVYTYRDYFVENDTRESGRDRIRLEWHHNQDAFEINESENQLCFVGQDNRDIKRMVHNFPEELEPQIAGSKVIMRLDVARSVFGLSFVKPDAIMDDIKASVRKTWRDNPSLFQIKRNRNLLQFDLLGLGPLPGDIHEIQMAFPGSLDAAWQGTDVSVNLDAARAYFGCTFKKGLFGK